MARSFNVSYRFTAKDSFSAVSKKIRAGNIKLGASFKGLSNKLKRTDRAFAKTSRGIMSGFKGMAIAAAGFFGIKEFFSVGATFQDALADLSAITGATGKDLDNLRISTLKLAKATITSQADVATGIKLIASAKPELLKNQAALLSTTSAVLLLKNTGIDLQSAVKATVGGLNAFGEGAAFANRNVNILAAGSKLGSSEISDTAEALKIAGPGARAAGLSFLQLNAAIQTVAKGEIKGSQAGTALNAIFAKLRVAGIDFKKVGLQAAFQQVKTALEGIKSPVARAQAEFKIFGLEHAKVGLAILNNIELLGQFETTLSGTNIAQEQADIRLNTFSARMRKLGIVLKDVVIKTFLRLEPVISKQVQALAKFFESIDAKKVQSFADGLVTLINVGVALVKTFALVVGAFEPLGKAIVNTFTPILSIIKGMVTLVGDLVVALATLDFSGFTGVADAFSINGKVLGLFGNDAPAPGGVSPLDFNKFTGAGGIVPSLNFGEGGAIADFLSGAQPLSTGANVGAQSGGTTDINVNLNAPPGVVQSTQSRTTGNRAANVGFNMVGG